MSIETLLISAGGMGRFQWSMLLIVSMGKVFSGWSVLQMTFAGIIPDFYCETSVRLSHDPFPRNVTLNSCTVPGSSSSYNSGSGTDLECDAYNFTGSYSTVITDFDLVCDKAWVKPAVTSIQMTGLLVGAVIAGQLGDTWGRWRTNFLFALIMAVSNIATAFSNSWQVFALCRFIIGAGIGGSAVMVFILNVEFMTPKWRPIAGCFPSWAIGVCCFSLSAYLLQDWRNIQLACGVGGLLVLPLLLLVPESPRWLTVRGRLKEARATIEKVARWNGKPSVPHVMETLQTVYEQEKKAREGGQRYTYLDVFYTWTNTKTTLIMSYHWFCYALLYYGISFGISSLAGNIFLNIFLLGIIELPTFVTFFLNKNLGRKWTAALAVTSCLTCLIVCMVLQIVGFGGNKSLVVTGFSLAARTAAIMAWVTSMTWGSELYPTVIRSDERMAASYTVLAAVLAVDLVLVFLLPDTKNTPMQDSFNKLKAPNMAVARVEAAHSSTCEKTEGKESSPPITSAEESSIDMAIYPHPIDAQPHPEDGPAYVNRAMDTDDEEMVRFK
ncbi:hypothetical protein EGW08_016173 [Elysia chlorotica]|uniref:Major facilitator superfamily (MFS) profile domain-containing protein n=1 Tax=Elysia chlorotica TaxID=188477 RepID=A0A433T3D1_ELYCH|nr:hypothetical protein EGW08_016173 [Elysia chlorotica]